MESSFERMTNSLLFRIGEVIWDLLLLSVLWLVFSIPVVTCGAATSALYFAVHRRFSLHNSTPAKDFIRSFKLNLKQGLVLNLIFLIYAAVVGFNIRVAVYGWGEITLPDWYLPVALLLLIPLLLSYPLTFPYLARFTSDTKHLLLNSTLMSVMNPGRTLLIWFYTILAVAAMIYFPPCALIAPAGVSFLIMRSAEKTFKAALDNEKSREESEETEETDE